MPHNIALAAFVLGAVLLLLGLSKGGFKFFGAEMSGTTGLVPRLLSGIAGALLIGFGLWHSNRSGPAEGTPPIVARENPPPKTDSPEPIPPGPPKRALPAGRLSDTEDSVQLLEVSPAPGSFLHRGQPQTFNLTVAYSLQSTDAAILSLSVDQIRESEAKAMGRSGQLTDAAEVPIQRGKHRAKIALTWSGDSEQATKGNVDMKGYLRFVPMFWRSMGGHRGERIRVFEGYEGVWLRFGP